MPCVCVGYYIISLNYGGIGGINGSISYSSGTVRHNCFFNTEDSASARMRRKIASVALRVQECVAVREVETI